MCVCDPSAGTAGNTLMHPSFPLPTPNSVPTAFVFLARFLKAADADARTQQLATYCVERCQQEYRMLQHLPSRMTAAAVNVALRTTRGRSAWTPTMTFYTGFTEEELRLCVLDVETVMDHCLTSSLQVRVCAINHSHSLESP